MFNYSAPEVIDSARKPESLKAVITAEAQHLETPAESEAFLKHMMRHAQKVSTNQKRLATFSRFLMTTGVVLAAGSAFLWLAHTETSAASAKPKLGQSSQDTTEVANMFSGISIAIWGMIAAKAKTGLSAATKGESKTVGEALQQAGALILMIAVASGINMYTSVDDYSTPFTPTETANKPMLSASNSIVTDKGMLAAAYSQFETMSADDFKNVGSQTPQLKESSQRGRKVNKGYKPSLSDKEATKTANIDMILPAFNKAKAERHSGQDFNKQLKSVGAFMLFVVTSGISMAYYVTF